MLSNMEAIKITFLAAAIFPVILVLYVWIGWRSLQDWRRGTTSAEPLPKFASGAAVDLAQYRRRRGIAA